MLFMVGTIAISLAISIFFAVVLLIRRIRAFAIVSKLWIDSDIESTDWLESGHYLEITR
ncbi:hypothetical protein C1752_06639 [Acaryochloris thomasi RCC1774]|uniref:Uncharacterized protein n=1 Tax=Acaryochloris thomasi RCC1774 TaxID=1764569 RepID=A0A2W1JB86_9CYAN|nr:hypothetical protein C1752_06639 [Acaryochloris thomasi RCC1774]